MLLYRLSVCVRFGRELCLRGDCLRYRVLARRRAGGGVAGGSVIAWEWVEEGEWGVQ